VTVRKQTVSDRKPMCSQYPDTASIGATRIRVLCVDDHRVVREGITALVGRQEDMEVVGAAATGVQAIELYRQYRPDVTLIDLQMPVMSGLEAIQAIRAENGSAKIIVLTMYHGEEDIYRALQAGAASYLLKEAVLDDLPRIVREVHYGSASLPDEVKRLLATRCSQVSLTSREIEVLELVAQGFRNKEIAAALGITGETAKVHVKNILAKLEVTDRTAAVTKALKRGIIHMD
jgi:two-component system NarL family response regulator